MNIKTFIIPVLLIAISFLTCLPAAASPDVSGEATVLIDADSGEVLFEKNADTQMLIASTTKIMTALVVLENCSCDEEVEIKAEYTQTEGSSMYLQAGEVLTVRELLYGLMLVSGNDAATALACYVAGSIEDFAKMMNDEVEKLGLENSQFKNPHGLDEDGHYSTAHDLAIITAEAMKNNTFCEIVSTKSITIGNRCFTNHNKLLWTCDGVIGVKTGYTKTAGRSLVSCAERDGLTLICVTLNDGDDWNDHTALYDWAFSNFRYEKILDEKNDSFTIPVISGEKDSVKICPEEEYTAFLDSDDSWQVSVYLPEFVYAEVKAGDAAGRAEIFIDGKKVETVDLIYTETVKIDEDVELNFWEQIKRLWYLTVEYSVSKFGYYPNS